MNNNFLTALIFIAVGVLSSNAMAQADAYSQWNVRGEVAPAVQVPEPVIKVAVAAPKILKSVFVKKHKSIKSASDKHN